MFNLTDGDLQWHILDIVAGTASSTAEIHIWGDRVTEIEPIYRFIRVEIKQRFNE